MCFIKIQIFAWETFQECLLQNCIDLCIYKSFPGKNLNFDKANTQPLSLLRLDSSTYIETLFKSAYLLYLFRTFLFGLLLNASWNANLISYLSTQKTHLPFHSLDGLLDSTSYKIAIMSGSADEDYFKLSADPVKQKAWTERVEPFLNYFGQHSGMYLIFIVYVSSRVSI